MIRIKAVLSKFLVFVLAIQILNLSVYGSAYMQRTIGKDGQVTFQLNQIDSLAEYITEVVLKDHNAFPEFKGGHTKRTFKIIKVAFQVFYITSQATETPITQVKITVPFSFYVNNYNYSYYQKKTPPPNQPLRLYC